MREESLDFLRAEGVSAQPLDEVLVFRKYYKLEEAEAARVPVSLHPYCGREAWEEAVGVLLVGEHLPLTGGKASGKNMFAEGLMTVFGRPLWDISPYMNVDAASLIGMDASRGGEVQLRKESALRAAECGSSGVLDEINMAKNESLAVLHATLNFRHVIGIPGYDGVQPHEATRLIGAVNYGYVDTCELNEALASHFLVIQMPVIPETDVQRLLLGRYPTPRPEYTTQFTALSDEIREENESGEITSCALDLRGVIATIGMITRGLSSVRILRLGVANRCFDSYEQALVNDLIATRLPESPKAGRIFT